MKKSVLILSAFAILFLAFQSFRFKSADPPVQSEDVKALLKNSCFDCHSNEASGDKSKGALNFDEWSDYKDSRKISRLDAICEVVEEGKMPPEKYLKKFPEKALSEEHRALVCNWAEEELGKLMEGK